MEVLALLIGIAAPIGLFLGWVLGISGWRQARQAQAELAALCAALRAAGIAVPEAAAAPAGARPDAFPTAVADEAMAARPNPWAARAAADRPATAAEPAAPPPAAARRPSARPG